jgi:hypothetical protein
MKEAGQSLKDKDLIEAAIDTFCNGRLSSKDDKMCYYFQPIKKHISQPVSLGLPKMKVCERLMKDNSEICDVKYPIKVDKDVDYNKLRVKQLKQILNDRGTDCVGCIEKPDYVSRCKETEHLEL